MFAVECINIELPSLQPEDSGLTALSLLEEFNLNELPLVDNDRYIGLISEYDLLDNEFIERELKEFQPPEQKPHVLHDSSMMDVIYKMDDEAVSIMPVLDDQERYIGCIDHSYIIGWLAEAEGMRSPGGILQIELNVHDYSLAEISRLIESNDTKILHLQITSEPDSELITVHLKLNKTEVGPAIQTLERFNYNVTAIHRQEGEDEDLKRRYDGFMKYLNI